MVWDMTSEPQISVFLVVNSVNSLFLLLKFQNRPPFAISKQSEDKDIVDPLAELCGPVAIPPPRELMVRWGVWIYGFVRVTPTRIIIIGTYRNMSFLGGPAEIHSFKRISIYDICRMPYVKET